MQLISVNEVIGLNEQIVFLGIPLIAMIVLIIIANAITNSLCKESSSFVGNNQKESVENRGEEEDEEESYISNLYKMK